MAISKIGKKLIVFVLTVAFVLSGIIYTPKSASAADNDQTEVPVSVSVSVLGSSLRLNKEGDNDGTQSMKIGIEVKNASYAKACSITLTVGNKPYTVATLPGDGVDMVSPYIYSRDIVRDTIVYAVVLTNIPIKGFNTPIKIDGTATEISTNRIVTAVQQTRTVNGIVSAMQQRFPELGIFMSDAGILMKHEGEPEESILTAEDIAKYEPGLNGDVTNELDLSKAEKGKNESGEFFNYNSEKDTLEVNDTRESGATEINIPLGFTVKPGQTVTITIAGPSWGDKDFRIWTVPEDARDSGEYVLNNGIFLGPDNAKQSEAFVGAVTLTAKTRECDYITLKAPLNERIKGLVISSIKAELGPPHVGWNEDKTEYTLEFSDKNVSVEKPENATFTVDSLENTVVFDTTEVYSAVVFDIPEEILNNYAIYEVDVKYEADNSFTAELDYEDVDNELSDLEYSDLAEQEMIVSVKRSNFYNEAVQFKLFSNNTDTVGLKVEVESITLKVGPKPIAYAYEIGESAPKIDGNATDVVWAYVPWQSIENRGSINAELAPTTTEAKTKIAWDANYLYGLVVVNDSDISHEHDQDHQRDGIELFMDEDRSRNFGTEGELSQKWGANTDAFQYRYTGFTSEDSSKKTDDVVNGCDYDILTQSTYDNEKGRYIIEYCIPFQSAKELNNVVAFDCVVQDCTDDGRYSEIYMSNLYGKASYDYYGTNDNFALDLKLVQSEPLPTPMPAREPVELEFNAEDIKVFSDKEGAKATVNGDGSVTYEEANGFGGLAIPIPEEYVIGSGQSFHVDVRFTAEGLSDQARVYLINNGNDISMSNILGKASSPIKGMLTVQSTEIGELNANANYIFVKADEWNTKFTSLTINSITLSDEDLHIPTPTPAPTPFWGWNDSHTEYTLNLDDCFTWQNNDVTMTKNTNGTYTFIASESVGENESDPKAEFGFCVPSDIYNRYRFTNVVVKYRNASWGTGGYTVHYGTDTVGYIAAEEAHYGSVNFNGSGELLIQPFYSGDGYDGTNYYSNSRFFSGIVPGGSVTIESITLSGIEKQTTGFIENNTKYVLDLNADTVKFDATHENEGEFTFYPDGSVKVHMGSGYVGTSLYTPTEVLEKYTVSRIDIVYENADFGDKYANGDGYAVGVKYVGESEDCPWGENPLSMDLDASKDLEYWKFFTHDGYDITINSVTYTLVAKPEPTPAPTFRPVISASDADLKVYKTDKVINVDGIADDKAWDDAEELKFTNYSENDYSTGTTATAKVLWDDSRIYLLVEVEDDAVIANNSNEYENDGIEFYLDEDLSKENSYDENIDMFQYRYTKLYEGGVDGKGFRTRANNGSDVLYEGTVAEHTMVTGGYIVEASIPFANPATIQPGVGMGFEIYVMDCIAGSRKNEIYLLSDGDLYNNPGGIATIQLVEEGVAIPTPVPTPEPDYSMSYTVDFNNQHVCTMSSNTTVNSDGSITITGDSNATDHVIIDIPSDIADNGYTKVAIEYESENASDSYFSTKYYAKSNHEGTGYWANGGGATTGGFNFDAKGKGTKVITFDPAAVPVDRFIIIGWYNNGTINIKSIVFSKDEVSP